MIGGIILVVLSGGSLAAGAIALNQVGDAVHQDSLLASGSRHQHGDTVKGPLNMLLAGSDLRNSWKKTGQKPRTDSIMWLHIPASHDRAYLLSVARDLRVDIPANPSSNFAGANEKLNASFSDGMTDVNDVAGGMKLLSKTVSKVTGTDFDMAGLVNWDGFKDITKALGGVTMCLQKGFTSTQPGFQQMNLTFKAGCHHYGPKKALLLVRQRDDVAGGDYGRQQLQQQFIKQILKQATSKGVISHPSKLNRVIKAAGKSLTLDLGGYTVLNLALALHDITPDKIVTLQPPHEALWNDPANQAGYLGESLQEPDADNLFKALRSGTIDDFLANHPDMATKPKDVGGT